MSIEFLVTSLIVVIAPGTGVVYTLSHGISRGALASVVAATGCTLGILPHLAAAVFGLAALLHASAVAFQTAKFVGVAYLLYLGWRALREQGALEVSDKVEGRRLAEIAFKGFLVNILNPKLSMFFLAFLPQFISAGQEGATWHMLGLGGVFMLMTLVIFIGYGLFAARLRDHVVTKPRVMAWLHRAFAGAFGLLALRLALAER